MDATPTTQSTTAPHNKRLGYFVTGAVGLVLSAIYLFLSRDYSFGEMDQPGARVWPTVVGLMMVVSSGFVLWEGWRMSPTETFEMPSGPGAKRVVLMIVLMVAYFASMEFLGQLIASALFCVFFMRLVSPLTWPKLVAASLGISLGLYVIFVVVLKIPMPKGVLGF
jgi:hypothetical protein